MFGSTLGGWAFFRGEPDPTKLVMITGALAATALPADDEHHDGRLEKFVTLRASRSGEVFRGVAFAPAPKRLWPRSSAAWGNPSGLGAQAQANVKLSRCADYRAFGFPICA